MPREPRAAPAGAVGAPGISSDSPGRLMYAMVSPGPAFSPSARTLRTSTPASAASTSLTPLSVSTSNRGSPMTTMSPSAFNQRTRVTCPSTVPRSGIRRIVAIASLSKYHNYRLKTL